MDNAIEIRHYLTSSGKDVFDEWLGGIADTRTPAKIAARINRLASGSFGDYKALRGGVCELRIDWGSGYRVYYAMTGKSCALLLCGGDKRGQSADIEQAVKYFEDYKARTRNR